MSFAPQYIANENKHHSMNGLERVQLQCKNNVRGIVEAIDELRFLLGMGNAIALTPIAETRLRSGLSPVKDMKLLCTLNETLNHQIIITFPNGYPFDANFKFELVADSSDQVDQVKAALYQFLDAHQAQSHTEMKTSAMFVVEFVKEARSLMHTNMVILKRGGISAEDATAMMGIEDEEDKREQEESPSFDVGKSIASPAERVSSVHYTCQRCRFPVMSDDTLVHDSNPMCLLKSAVHFLDSERLPEWILGEVARAEKLGVSEGKLICPGLGNRVCGSKLGVWGWVGQSCNACGEWLAPVFTIAASKVDKKQIY